MTWDQILRAFMLAGFDRAEQSAFLAAWDTPVEELDAAAALLVARFYGAAYAADTDDKTSYELALSATAHAYLLREVAA